MAKSNGKSNGNGSGAADRYRQAATDALEMVDWCIGFLVASHKEGIASQLARNRTHIRQQLMHESSEPMPTDEE